MTDPVTDAGFRIWMKHLAAEEAALLPGSPPHARPSRPYGNGGVG